MKFAPIFSAMHCERYMPLEAKGCDDCAHFLSRQTKLKKRKTIVMMIPQVARTPSITVTAMCTVTVSSFGTPSYGIPSTDRQENEQYVIASFQALGMRPKHVNDSLVPRPSPPFLYCKRSKTGGGNGLGTRLCKWYVLYKQSANPTKFSVTSEVWVVIYTYVLH